MDRRLDMVCMGKHIHRLYSCYTVGTKLQQVSQMIKNAHPDLTEGAQAYSVL